MINEKSVIAIIPARGGSKGLPRKNIKELCGKPLIAWSIEAGLGSKYIDEMIVTTDSEEIAHIARAFGASVPFMRPTELASDTATSFDAIKHTLDYCENALNKKFDYIVLLEPTSPLRDRNDIDMAIEQLLSNPQASALVGICKTESQNPAFLVKKNDENFLVGYENKNMKVLRRQDISDVYFFEGSIYVSHVETLLTEKTFYHERTLGYEVPKWKALEVDDLDDFVMIEALMKHKGSNV
jgi:N-acylneuraminate cytidylyltransferase/CMP-N,N'-diacetyllegionaminic acid synthase